LASADYKLCDICSCKTFYDANVDYEGAELCGDMKCPRKHSGDFHIDEQGCPLPLGVGDWKVICFECSKTNRVIIEKIETKND